MHFANKVRRIPSNKQVLQRKGTRP